MNPWIKNSIGVTAIVLVAFGTDWAIHRAHRPGQLDVISAQAMDMSRMRPPTGAAPVALASARLGSLAETVTYTGTIAAYNEQDISPRITGTLVSLPVYPGDSVRAGQIVAKLDTSQVGPQADQAADQAREAQIGARVAHLTHYLHHHAELEQAEAQVQAAQATLAQAQAEVQADQDATTDARAGVQSAQAQADYWRTEIVREKQLADAGAASQQEYQGEMAQAQAAQATLTQAQARVSQAQATAQATRAKVTESRRQVDVAQAGVKMAQADIAVAEGQAEQAGAGASAQAQAARVASVQEGYSQITSPFDGVVTARLVAPGTLVQAGTVILKVSEIARVRVQANVAVEDMAGVHVGSPVQIVVQNGDGQRPLSARVTSVFPSASTDTRTAVVEAVIPNPGHRLLPGAFVTMRIANNTDSDGLLVPSAAVVSEGGQSFVWTTGGGETAAVGTTYQCTICHMHYTAARARKLHYRDPMDGGRLVALGGVRAMSPTADVTAHQVAVQVGASDGDWTEVAPGPLTMGARVVTHGQAGLTDGARVVATAWGTDGPQILPTAAAAGHGRTVYRCEKCGMTYSAADAARDNYIDPMDGGRLIPVTGGAGGG